MMKGMATARTGRLLPEQFQAIARAVAEPRRFAMLQQIAASESVLCSGLDNKACLSPATVSHHLKELHEAGLIETEREGRALRMHLRRDVWDAYLHELASL